MLTNYPPQKLLVILFVTAIFASTTTFAQVGINTTAPANGSILDVTSSDKGALLPRLDIVDLSTIAPVTGGGTEGLLAYNTNATTGPGYVFWDGTQWVSITAVDDDWKLLGNAGTTPGTGAGQNFLGTTDSRNLVLATNGTEALRVTTGQRLQAGSDGSAATPTFSFTSDADTGMYRSGANNLSLATGATERLSIESSGQVRNHTVGNAATPSYSFESDPDVGMYRSGGDVLSFSTSGAERLSIESDGQTLSHINGSSGTPSFSFDGDANTGIYRGGTDDLHITSGGREMASFSENGNSSEVVINDTGVRTNFRVEGDGQANLFVTDSQNDRIGINTNAPQNDVHIAGTGTGIRVDAFNSANNVDNNGVDDAVVFVDANGDLLIKSSLEVNQLPEDNSITFVPTQTPVQTTTGALASQVLYTTTFTLTQDALVEVVYQLGTRITSTSGLPLTDGRPRQYGTALFIDTELVGYTSEAYTSYINPNDTGGPYTIMSGVFFLNGNGYAELTGAPAGTTYTIQVVGFVAAGTGDNVRGTFGGNAADRFQLITHY